MKQIIRRPSKVSTTLVVGLAAACLSFGGAFTAHADSNTAPSDQQEEQAQQAAQAWKDGAEPETSADAESVSDGNESVRTRVASNYRGSFLMWARESVEFGFTGSKVTWSSGHQSSGAIFPNTVSENGTTRIHANDKERHWRGSYTVGAGVPTPWGNANVYHATSTIRTKVQADGGWRMWWIN